MTKLIYGDGKIRTQQGIIEGEGKCLSLTRLKDPLPVGATAKEFNATESQEMQDVILVFKSLESARTLQDEINELCAIWSREESQKVTDPFFQPKETK